MTIFPTVVADPQNIAVKRPYTYALIALLSRTNPVSPIVSKILAKIVVAANA